MTPMDKCYKERMNIKSSEKFVSNRAGLSMRTLKLLEGYIKQDGMDILDVGADVGISVINFSELLPKSRVIGIEPDEYFVEKAKKNIKNAKSRAKVVKGDGTDMPFEDNSFDLVLCEQVIEHVKDKEAIIKEMHRVLRKEGILFASIPNKTFPIESHCKFPVIHWLPRCVFLFFSKFMCEKKRRCCEGLYLISSLKMERRLADYFRDIEYVSGRFLDDDMIKLSPNTMGFHTIGKIIKPFSNSRTGKYFLKLLFPYGGFVCKK